MLLIIINCVFLIMTGPLNICLIIQSFVKHFSLKIFSLKFFVKLNQYLRLLQIHIMHYHLYFTVLLEINFENLLGQLVEKFTVNYFNSFSISTQRIIIDEFMFFKTENDNKYSSNTNVEYK